MPGLRVKDWFLEAFKKCLFDFVANEGKNYGGLQFGTPGLTRTYTAAEYIDLNLGVDLVGKDVDKYIDGIGKALGIEFSPVAGKNRGFYKGAKKLMNPGNVEYEIDVGVWNSDPDAWNI